MNDLTPIDPRDAQRGDVIDSTCTEVHGPAIATPEAQPAEAGDVHPSDADGDPDFFNDAELLGQECPEFEEILSQPATLLIGEMWGAKDRRNTQDGDWKQVTMPWVQWIDGMEGNKNTAAWGFSRHPEGKEKAGACVVFGSSIGQARKAKAMSEMFAMGIDIDSGITLDEILPRLEALGLFCLVYTSHSHGKRGLQLKHDVVIQKLKIKPSELNKAQVQKYLREIDKNRYDESFISKIEIKEMKKQVKEGVVIELATPPLDKFRLIFPLAQPVKIIDLAETQGAALEVWEDKITGLATELLGVHFDTSCTDPSRLFYTARHPKGAEDWFCGVVRGKPLVFEDVPVVRKSSYTNARRALNAFEMAGGVQDDGDKPPMAFAPSGASLNDWHRVAKDRFNMADLLDDQCPDRIRVAGGEAQGHAHIECPFEHEHTSEGGTATMVVNALDSQSGYWSWFCHHDACQNRHKLEFLEEALRQNWFDENLLFGDSLYLMPGEDPEEDEDDDESVIDDTDGSEVSAADLHKRFRKLIRKGYAPGEDLDAMKRGKKDSGLTQADVKKLWNKALAEITEEKDKEAREARKAAPRAEYVPREQATRRSVEAAAENAAWLPSFAQYRRGDDGAWFYVRDLDNPKEYVRACRAFEVPFIAFGETSDGTRTNSITIRYPHRSKQVGIVESSYRIGDTYRDTGAFLSTLVDAGFEIDPMVDIRSIVRLLRSVDTSSEAVLVEKSGWYGDAYVSPSGVTAHAGDKRYILLESKRISAQTRGTLEAHHAAATTALTGATGAKLLPGYLSGLAGCLVNFIDHELSPVISIEGKAKHGKSSAGKMGAAHFGPPNTDGLFWKADATANAGETLAEKGNGAVIVLDEGGASRADSAEKQRLILQWADGTGRARGTQYGGMARTRVWKTCFTLSSEIGVVAAMESDGIDIKTGAVSRVFIVNFEDVPLLDVDGPEVAAIRILTGDDSAHAVFGVTGPVFAEKLAEIGRETIRARVSALSSEWGDLARGAGDRIVATAAIIAVAGEVAQEAGLFGEAVNVRGVMRGLLVEALAAGSAHLDTEKQSIEKLRRAIQRGVRTGAVATLHEDLEARRDDVLAYWAHLAANGRPDHAAWQKKQEDIRDAARNGKDFDAHEADEREARTYILPVDRLGKLGILTDPKALADRLRAAGALVTRKKGKREEAFHDYVPGEGQGRNLRVTGAFVHGDWEDDEARDLEE